MKRRLRMTFAAVALIALVTACAALGFAPAQTFEQKLAYAYTAHTAVLNTAAVGVQSGALTGGDGKNVLNGADNARAFLDAAHATMDTDTATAAGRLSLATSILTQLQSFVCAAIKKKDPTAICAPPPLPGASS